MDVSGVRGSEKQHRPLTLRQCRWYSLTLRGGTVVILQAWRSPRVEAAWELYANRQDNDDPASFWVQTDGTLVLETGGGFDSEAGRRVIDEELTAYQLVRADQLARAAWATQVGPDDILCPRCDQAGDAAHHPLCHTAEGVPLFPEHDPDQWLGEVRDHVGPWESAIRTDSTLTS